MLVLWAYSGITDCMWLPHTARPIRSATESSSLCCATSARSSGTTSSCTVSTCSIADSSGGRAHGLSVQNRTDLPDTRLSLINSAVPGSAPERSRARSGASEPLTARTDQRSFTLRERGVARRVCFVQLDGAAEAPKWVPSGLLGRRVPIKSRSSSARRELRSSEAMSEGTPSSASRTDAGTRRCEVIGASQKRCFWFRGSSE